MLQLLLEKDSAVLNFASMCYAKFQLGNMWKQFSQFCGLFGRYLEISTFIHRFHQLVVMHGDKRLSWKLGWNFKLTAKVKLGFMTHLQ